MKDLILKHWNGEERLWKVYWIYGILLGVILFGVIGNALVVWLSFSIDHYFPLSFSIDRVLPLVIYNAWTIAYMVWNNVSIWRCSDNVNWKGWVTIARILVVLGIISTLVISIGLDQPIFQYK